MQPIVYTRNGRTRRAAAAPYGSTPRLVPGRGRPPPAGKAWASSSRAQPSPAAQVKNQESGWRGTLLPEENK